MRTVSFTLYGSPVTWQRAKWSKIGKAYNGKKMVSYQNRIHSGYIEAIGKIEQPIDAPFGINLKCYFPIPASFPKWKKAIAAQERLPYLPMPDMDNLAKNICDALEGVVFTNDSRVVEMYLIKRYSQQPRAEITIYFFDSYTKDNVPEDTDMGQLSMFENGKEE